jgi:hypothetical protein
MSALAPHRPPRSVFQHAFAPAYPDVEALMLARLDHLVIVANTLDEGVAWCESTLGVTPAPGGEHPLMGTHNRLLRIATVDFPRAYLEVIAINSIAAGAIPMRPGRWFDMENAEMMAQIAQHGPRLVHFVANVPDIAQAGSALRALDIDRGEAIAASRMTPRGLLEWQITVRGDGRRLFDGALPTLIEWGEVHPAASLPDAGVALQSVHVSHPQAATLRAAYDAVGLAGVAVHEGPANLCATLATPRGLVTLQSEGL